MREERHELKRIILAGAGHAHLLIALQGEKFIRENIEFTLIDPGRIWYSGLATGMLGGMYDDSLDTVDPEPVVKGHGGTFDRGRVVRTDTQKNRILLDDGSTLPYDALSFNVGSETPVNDIPGAKEHCIPVKPVKNLWHLRQSLEEQFSNNSKGVSRIVVIGGGPSGCEIAANLSALARRKDGRVKVTLITRGQRLLSNNSKSAANKALVSLKKRDTEVLFQREISLIDNESLWTAKDERIEYNHTIFAAGLRPPGIFREWGLETGADGGLKLDHTLRSVTASNVFGAGDCIAFGEIRLPKLGVFAVREAAVLQENLINLIRTRALRAYTPQKRYLSIFNYGDGEALATWGNFSWHGKISHWLKDRIDRRFLNQFR